MKKGKSVLFFGRRNCNNSIKAIEFLTKLGFQVKPIFSSGRDDKLPKTILRWAGDYIFCFRSLYILPKSLIERAAKGAINFHPGPPEYPGSGCINFALYENSQNYGVTCHFMTEKIDSGKIIKCKKFKIRKSDNVDTLLKRTHKKLLELLFEVASDIVDNDLQHIKKFCKTSKIKKWSGTRRKIKSVEDLSTISVDIEKEELDRIIRATYTHLYPPKIILHGHEFFLRLK